jgi:hypothetical protein
MHQGANLVADVPHANGIAFCHHFAGDLQARQIRGVGRHGIVAAALQDIGPVHARGGHADEDLVRLGRRNRALHWREHLGATRLRNLDGPHGRGNLCRNIHLCHHNDMAQFRVEFLLDEVSGKYLAEMYHPDRHDELLVRTEALYPTQAAAVLGVVQLFKNAVLQFPPEGTPAKTLARPQRLASPKKRNARSAKPVKAKAKAKSKAKVKSKAKAKRSKKRK